MRTREEIEKDWKENKNAQREAEIKVELLLDIRDLLTPNTKE